MSGTNKGDSVADLLSGEAAEAEAKRVERASGKRVEGSGTYVHPSEHIDHERLSIAEEGALEVSEHLERKSREATAAVPTRSRKASRPPKAKVAARKAAAKKTAAAAKPKKKPLAKTAAKPAGTERARDVALQILKRKGGEMPVKDLAEAVVASGRTKLGGKTPAATVGAQIYVSAKKGELFKVVSRGVVAVLEAKS